MFMLWRKWEVLHGGKSFSHTGKFVFSTEGMTATGLAEVMQALDLNPHIRAAFKTTVKHWGVDALTVEAEIFTDGTTAPPIVGTRKVDNGAFSFEVVCANEVADLAFVRLRPVLDAIVNQLKKDALKELES